MHDIVSRGLTDRYSAWGSPADPRAAAALEAATGLSSDGHGSRALTAADVDGAAVVFYFTDEHVGWTPLLPRAGPSESGDAGASFWQNFGKILFVFGCIGTDFCK